MRNSLKTFHPYDIIHNNMDLKHMSFGSNKVSLLTLAHPFKTKTKCKPYGPLLYIYLYFKILDSLLFYVQYTPKKNNTSP